MKSRRFWSPNRRLRMVAAAALVGVLSMGAQPALAEPPDGGSGVTTPGAAWEPDIKKAGPVTLPGTDTKITPFATPLRPTQPKALRGVTKGTGATLKAGGAAVRRAAMPSLGKSAGPDDPPTGLYCTEQIGRSTSVSGRAGQLDYAADVTYLAEFGCNFYLDAAYIVSGVIDRGRFDGQFLSTTTPQSYGQTYYGATQGGVRIPGELFDGGRSVETVFELYLLAPVGVFWGGCFQIPGLRYLACEGLGTNLLHIVVGTGSFATGLQPPVIRYAALGDSYSSGTGAPPYTNDLCRRSPVTYANLIAGTVVNGLPVDRPDLVACHGAKTIDFYTSQQPGLAPQLDAVQRNTRLVTLTIGGNDLGFSPKFTGCYVGADCSGAGPLASPQELSETQVKLTALYQQIRAQMNPSGQLMVVSYPAVLPVTGESADPQPTPQRCPSLGENLILPERNAINDATSQADRMIRDAVIATGDSRVTYVNGLDLFRGHRLCSESGVWANGFVSPIGDSFHPNADGYRSIANRLAQLLQPV